MENQASVYFKNNHIFWNTEFGNYQLYFSQELFSKINFENREEAFHQVRFCQNSIRDLKPSQTFLRIEQTDKRIVKINNVFYRNVDGYLLLQNGRIGYCEFNAMRLEDRSESFTTSAHIKYREKINPFIRQTEKLLPNFVLSNQEYYYQKLNNYLLSSQQTIEEYLLLLS